ncbi:thioesterase family protein [Ammoniphilus sp. CFH 90114]|uniref:acyl-CoA thioesterase n=1 Tax=Ammoniphilus sp. CFH 90114 TaxID=2493665 RepID=UPI00100F0E7A|nr:thioesterase family protein [Ammoniphilus sp. CFH 90114]RXT04785.1 acyl-CoA thioesterase [Ammoniphilus sp. CFH 90114]
MPRTVESRVRVRYQETDQMKVVYHANYLVWFEIGRTDYIRELGISYSHLEQMGILLPVLEVQCKYIQAAKYEDELKVETTVSELKGVRLTFKYQVKRVKDDQLLAEGWTQHVFATTDLKPVNLRSKMPELYRMIIDGIE